MATRRVKQDLIPKPVLCFVMSRDDARDRLQERIEKGLILKRRHVATQESYEELSNEYSKWDSFNSELLKRIFSNDEMEGEYSAWVGAMLMSLHPKSLSEEVTDIHKEIDKKIHRIDSIVERFELIPLNESLLPVLTPVKDVPQALIKTKKVFVVHGHDESAKNNLEILLHEIGLEPVVLHRQADEGMTIIEKFEKHSDVGYAFILLTPDDVAYQANEDIKPDEQRVKEFRARPNVIFEFGYFVGKLGRSRVCCLYSGNVTLPSDVSGMIYKRYDKSIEEVAYSVTKDLKASGYVIA